MTHCSRKLDVGKREMVADEHSLHDIDRVDSLLRVLPVQETVDILLEGQLMASF